MVRVAHGSGTMIDRVVDRIRPPGIRRTVLEAVARKISRVPAEMACITASLS